VSPQWAEARAVDEARAEKLAADLQLRDSQHAARRQCILLHLTCTRLVTNPRGDGSKERRAAFERGGNRASPRPRPAARGTRAPALHPACELPPACLNARPPPAESRELERQLPPPAPFSAAITQLLDAIEQIKSGAPR
jgi:hypothetical protein